jgi:hypothetical protein
MQNNSERSTVQKELHTMNNESKTIRKVALVVGANGVIGRNLIDHLITLPDCLFRWNELWPKIAHYFGLETAPPLQMSLDVVMADKEQLWNKMVEIMGLLGIPIKTYPPGDSVISCSLGITISSPTELRPVA